MASPEEDLSALDEAIGLLEELMDRREEEIARQMHIWEFRERLAYSAVRRYGIPPASAIWKHVPV